MDYIYSYLNDDVASREMHGSETNTAVVTVNAATNTISVDVKPISPSMLNITKPTESGSYILQETISEIGEVSYSWATLEDYNQEVTQAIANLTQQLEQEKQERIKSVQAEANTRELADTQLRTEFTSELAQEKQEREQAVSEEAQRTNSMINQLNDNVQSGFNTINNVLTTSINNINNAILNESTIREEQFDDTTFRIRDLNTRLGVEIGNRESWDNIIYANLSAKIENEKRERVEQDQDIRDSISAEANSRQEALDELSNRIAGDIEEERQTRASADETLQSNIDAEASERKSVDQHLWDILPDNIIAGTPMQGMENANAINIVFSKYQKHGIGEDPADAELVEVPDQAITLFPATQEVAGVLTAADKTKIDNIANDIETAVQAEAEERQDADTALENKLDSLIVVEGDAIQVGREDKELNIKTGGRFTVNSNYEVVTSEEYPGEPGRRIIPLENNDQIAGKMKNGSGVPLIFVSEWDKVEVGGSGAPLNLNSDDGTVTVNDTYTLLNNEDKDKLNDAIEAEGDRATIAETALQGAIDNEKTRAEAAESSINASISSAIRKATHSVIDSASVTIISGDSASFNYTTYNPGSGAAGERGTTPIPMASTTSAGLMSNAHVIDLNNSLKLTGKTSQTVQGDITVQGNLVINGTTTTEDTETLMVQDNIIVTNSDGVELGTALSGVGIRTNTASTFGIVYDPSVSELQAGIGALDSNNSFSFNDNEGNPIALRDSNTELTDGNILVWTNAGYKLIDSNIPATQIARKDQAQTFNGIQTFVNAIEVPSINVNGVQLTSNVAGNIAVESQIKSAITNLVNGASTGYQTLGEIEACVVSVNDELQGYMTSTNSNIAQIEENINKINANTSAMNTSISSVQSCATGAYTQANNAYNQANTATTKITEHVADKNNPHGVTAEQIGLGNVDNTSDLDKPVSTATNNVFANVNACIAEVKTASSDATNITAGYLATNRIADGLIVSGNSSTTTVSKNSETGAYTVTAIVNKENVGLGNVKNVDATNASNINSGTLARNRIEEGLITNGANVTVLWDSESGVYTISAVAGGTAPVTSVNGETGAVVLNKADIGLGNVDNVQQYSVDNPPPYPVKSVAGKTGVVALSNLTFTGACTAKYNGASDVSVEIPTVPTMHAVKLSTNNGSASTVVGNVYSSSSTPIEIPIPESQTITLANTYNVKSGENGIVTGISLESGVLKVSYGALDDGTL